MSINGNCSLYYKQLLIVIRFGKNVDDGMSEREVSVILAPMTKYVVEIYTGEVTGAGTDSNVFVSLLGDKVKTLHIFIFIQCFLRIYSDI